MNGKLLSLFTIIIVILILFMCGSSVYGILNTEAAPWDQEEDTEQEDDNTYISVGFSQIGSESNWRMASSKSIEDSISEENGFSLIFEDGQQKQENQITAIRKFILQNVDYIILAPIVESGWDSVLMEARDAGIPVIMVDRRVNVSDSTLYRAWVGNNFLLEGRKACQWLKKFADANNIEQSDIHIVDIQGTTDASAQLGRTQGLEEAVSQNGWDLLAIENGDFTQAKGQEVMKEFLKDYPQLNVVYCENDDEAIGAIKALKDAGRKIGTKIDQGETMIIAFDATTAGLEQVLQGNIALDTECNPLLGPYIETIIQDIQSSKTVEKNTYLDENMFSIKTSVANIYVDSQAYNIIYLTEDILRNREY